MNIVKQDDTKFINDYEVLKDLGKGSYGKVTSAAIHTRRSCTVGSQHFHRKGPEK